MWNILFKVAGGVILSNAFESIKDNHIRNTVAYPAVGSVVYCDLAFGFAEHSGIYIGNQQIVHLNKYGSIEIVSPEQFTSGTTALSIYTASRNNNSVGSQKVAERARFMVGKRRNYNVLLDNCHQFSSGCLSGDFENYDNFLWMLKDTTKKTLNADTWLVWR